MKVGALVRLEILRRKVNRGRPVRTFYFRRMAQAVVALAAPALATPLTAQDQPDKVFKVFQFPPNKIPQIDGNADDWTIVPESYMIGTDQLHDDRGHHAKPDPTTLDIHVKVGLVKGLNRLYFLYEAYDDFWDFESPGLHHDTFELVVDGDLFGGTLLPQFRLSPAQDTWDSLFSIGSVMAQNYHIFTPAVGKDWAMALGCEPWVKEMPYANHAATYNFKRGGSGKYVMEFWITPFDYAGCEGPQRAVESKLGENKIIGMSWAVIDYDGPAKEAMDSGICPASGIICSETPRCFAHSASCLWSRNSRTMIFRRNGPSKCWT